jgi:hypothetical protein
MRNIETSNHRPFCTAWIAGDMTDNWPPYRAGLQTRRTGSRAVQRELGA